MKVPGFILLIFFLLMAGCKSKNKQEPIANKTDTTKFFQVADFIQSQIAEVNRTPYFIYRIIITGDKKDSTVINTPVFNQLSSAFLNPDINSVDLKKYYTESIFHDQTTKSFTISYATANKNLPIQSVDILLKEDGQTVKRLFIRKFFNYSDSSAIEQLSWKPDQSFEINRIVQLPGNAETTKQTIVVWNEKS